MKFRGIANLSVDSKGRIAVPKSHRGKLEAEQISELMITVDPDKCLLIYTMDSWEVFEKEILELPNTVPHNRGLQRVYVGYATEVELDGNGRILLPAMLRSYAGIEKKAVMIGQGQKLELWSEDAWHIKSSSYPELLSGATLESLSQEVRNLSI